MNKTYLDFTPLSALDGSETLLVDRILTGNSHELRSVALSSVADFIGPGSGSGEGSDPTKLPLTGGTLTGQLNGTTASFSSNVSAAAFYGDGSHLSGINSSDTAKLPLSGGTLTGQLNGTTASFSSNVSAMAFYGSGANLTGISTADSTKLPLSGGTLTGQLNGTTASFSSNVSAAAFYGSGANLTGISTTDTTKLPLSGGTLTGQLNGTTASFSSNVSAAAFYGNGANLTGIANSAIQIKEDRTNITSSDNGSLLRIIENGVDDPQRVYLPALSSANILNGFQVMVMQEGIKQLQFTPYGSDQIISQGNRVITAAQYSVATITKLSSAAWLLYGDLI